MAENSKIEWTHHTFNPWMGCTKVSPACKHCYAETQMDHRYGKVSWGPNGTRVKTAPDNWKLPLRWNRDAKSQATRFRVFCASLADVFEDWTGPIVDHRGNVLTNATLQTASDNATRLSMNDLRRDLFELIDATPNLDWLLLTKRPENIARMWPLIESKDDLGDVVTANTFRPNVWLGTSIENQQLADLRLPYLRQAKQAGLVGITFVSAEPLLGSITMQSIEADHLDEAGIDWVITGGESGTQARRSEADWFRSLRDQCRDTGTAFHFKQWGEHDFNGNRVGKKAAGRILDGKTHDEFPASLIAD